MTPGLAVLEASGLSTRAFAACTGCSTDRQIIADTKPATIVRWLVALRESGISLRVRAVCTIGPEGVTWAPVVERLDRVTGVTRDSTIMASERADAEVGFITWPPHIAWPD